VDTFPSKLIEEAVARISRLPGIGRKTALRLVLHLLKEDVKDVEALGNAIIKVRTDIKYCRVCHNISDDDICSICSSQKRDKSVICIVQDSRDIIAIENTSQFYGVYHVLGGIISPIDGIGPDDLNIKTLINKVAEGNIKEIVMALSTTIEGDTTVYYLYKKLKNYNVKVSIIARGISIGDELEYIDEVTLGRSILNRTLYEISS
jgi:recombination protein RecR